MSLRVIAGRSINPSNLKALGLLEEDSMLFLPGTLKMDLKILSEKNPLRAAIINKNFDFLKALFKQRIFERQNVFHLILQEPFNPHLRKDEVEKVMSCFVLDEMQSISDVKALETDERDNKISKIETSIQLKKEKMINVVDESNNSTLILAIKCQEIAFAEIFLQGLNNETLKAQSKVDGTTALIEAVKMNDIKLVEKILEKLPIKDRWNFVCMRNQQKETAIHIAVRDGFVNLREGSIDMVKFIVEKIDVKSRNIKEGTILHIAVEIGEIGFASMILDEVLDCEKKDFVQIFQDSSSALHIAARNGFIDLLREVIRRLPDNAKASCVMLPDGLAGKTPGIIAIESPNRDNLIDEVPLADRDAVMRFEDEMGCSMLDFL
ncbi:MAG: hypothetical protein KR126chlam6_00721 [Candidatus Anoxychlamydiales bacterium]|nr:hypothetical protein [Candidatus Anoxychlamydiales bacterium]